MNYYPEIGKFLLNFLEDTTERDKLSKDLIKEISFAKEEIMRPMRDIVKNNKDAYRKPIKDMIMSENPLLKALGARFISTGIIYDDIDVYNALKDAFTKEKEDDITKTVYAGALPFFRTYSEDHEIQNELESFIKRTLNTQIELTISNYGSKRVAVEELKKRLENPNRKSKHWIYQIILEELTKTRNNK